jgi:hypothetical protein
VKTEWGKWELRFAYFCVGKMGFHKLGLGLIGKKKPNRKWE